jgi:divalent metal cation (Fe/Co/Zn/Cd) transporter
MCSELGVKYHGVRFRTTGYRQLIEVHLLFDAGTPVGEAHRLATVVEERLAAALKEPSEVITHLESEQDHEEVHAKIHYTGVPS